jgi:hypothetical protein
LTISLTSSLELARRLERTEAEANAAYVDARRELQPEIGSAWIEVAGVYAMFDGVASPLTQTFGLGIFEPFLAGEFAEVEGFFRARGAPTCHEASSFAAPETLNLLKIRGYVPIEASVVLVRSTEVASIAASRRFTVRVIDETEVQLWSRVAARGWSSESTELAAFVEEFGLVTSHARGMHCFLAELDSQPVAAAALNVTNRIALLAGASTIPEARRRGAQLALLEARLRFASARGIDLAMVVTQPGSASQRNAERQGFRPAYTRSKWQLDTRGGKP